MLFLPNQMAYYWLSFVPTQPDYRGASFGANFETRQWLYLSNKFFKQTFVWKNVFSKKLFFIRISLEIFHKIFNF